MLNTLTLNENVYDVAKIIGLAHEAPYIHVEPSEKSPQRVEMGELSEPYKGRSIVFKYEGKYIQLLGESDYSKAFLLSKHVLKRALVK